MLTCVSPNRSMRHKQRDNRLSIISVVVSAYLLITVCSHVHAVRLCLHDSPLTQQYCNTVQEMKLWKLETCKRKQCRQMLWCKPTLHTPHIHTYSTHTYTHTHTHTHTTVFTTFSIPTFPRKYTLSIWNFFCKIVLHTLTCISLSYNTNKRTNEQANKQTQKTKNELK